MKKKDSAGLGMTIPKRMRMAGMTFYPHDGAVEDAAVLRRDVHRATDCLSEFCIAGEFPPMRKEVWTLVRYDMDGENNRRTFVMMQFFPSSLRLTDRIF